MKIELKIDDVVVFSNETEAVPAVVAPVATDVIPNVQTDAPASPVTEPVA